MMKKAIALLGATLFLTCFAMELDKDWYTRCAPQKTHRVISSFVSDTEIAILTETSNMSDNIRAEYPHTRLLSSQFDKSGSFIKNSTVEGVEQYTIVGTAKGNSNHRVLYATKDSIPSLIFLKSASECEKILTFPSLQGVTLLSSYISAEQILLSYYKDEEYKMLSANLDGNIQYTYTADIKLVGATENSLGDVMVYGDSSKGIIDSNGISTADYEIKLIQLDTEGAELSRTTIDGTNADNIYDLCSMKDGSWLLTGSSNGLRVSRYGNYNSRLSVAKISATGALLWKKEYGEEHSNCGRSLIRCEDGTIVIGGIRNYNRIVQQQKVYGNAWLLSLDSLGDTLSTYMQYGDVESFTNLQAVSGSSFIAQKGSNFYIASTDLSETTKLAEGGQSRYGNNTSFVRSLYWQDKIYSIGTTEEIGQGFGDIYLVISDTAGNTLSTNTFGDTLMQSASDMTIVSDTSLLIVGTSDDKFYTAEINSNGKLIYESTHYHNFTGGPDQFPSQQKTYGHVVHKENEHIMMLGRVIREDKTEIRLHYDNTQNKLTGFAMGYPVSDTTQPVAVQKYGNNFILLWSSLDSSTLSFTDSLGRIINQKSFSEEFHAMESTGDAIFLGGRVGKEGIIVKLNISGNEIWRTTMGEENNNASENWDRVTELKLTDNNRIVFGGFYGSNLSGYPLYGINPDLRLAREWIGILDESGRLLCSDTAQQYQNHEVSSLVQISETEFLLSGIESSVHFVTNGGSHNYYKNGPALPFLKKFTLKEDVSLTESPSVKHEKCVEIGANKVRLLNDIEQGKLQIFALNGQLMQSVELNKATISVDIRHLASGCYFMNVNGHGISETVKFMVR